MDLEVVITMFFVFKLLVRKKGIFQDTPSSPTLFPSPHLRFLLVRYLKDEWLHVCRIDVKLSSG